MTMEEVVQQVSFMLGIPANENTEDLQVEQAVLIAFRELKRYMKTPVDKTVPYSTRLDLVALGIDTVNVLYVQAAKPRIGSSGTMILIIRLSIVLIEIQDQVRLQSDMSLISKMYQR